MGGSSGGGGGKGKVYPNLDDNLMRQFYRGAGHATWDDNRIAQYFKSGQLIFKNNSKENEQAFRRLYGDQRVNKWMGIPEPAKVPLPQMPSQIMQPEGQATAADTISAAQDKAATLKRSGSDMQLALTRAKRLAESLYGSSSASIGYKSLLGD